MGILSGKTAPTPDEAEPTTIHMHFPGKSPVQPEGLEELSLEDDVVIMIKGKVNDLSRNEYRDEDNEVHLSRSLGVQVLAFKAAPVKADTAKSLYPDMEA